MLNLINFLFLCRGCHVSRLLRKKNKVPPNTRDYTVPWFCTLVYNEQAKYSVVCHGILTSSLFHQNDLFMKQTLFLATLNLAANMKLNEVKLLEQNRAHVRPPPGKV